MHSFDKSIAFAASLLPVTSHCTSFNGLSLCPASSHTHIRATHTKRSNRARIVSLGASPAPPPKEPEDDNKTSDTPPAEDVSEDVAPNAAAADTAPTEATDETPLEEVTADDILNSPSFLKKKLELVQKELIAANKKGDTEDEAIKEEKARYVRLAADFENYRRRSVEDLRLQDTKSTAKVCSEILTVLDNFERATSAVDAQSQKELDIVASYTTINKQLLDALAKLNVEAIDSVGQTFDPELHEAIQRMESTEYADEVVCQQFTRGYKIGETLIRAAIVAVSMGPGPEDGGDKAGADDSEAEEAAEESADETVEAAQ